MPILRRLRRGYPVVVVTGPRQSGKTTLVQALTPALPYVSLEDPDEREFAQTDPRGFLARWPRGIVLDEIQHCPQLFSYIQTRVDASTRMGDYVLTGSQQFGLRASLGQSLAGRAGLLELLPFSITELAKAKRLPRELDVFLTKGAYPPLYSRRVAAPKWHLDYVSTYVERDVRQLLGVRNLALFQRFVRMCAARIGQLLNLSSLGNDLGISHATAREWLSVLEASYIVFLLQPHHANLRKRLVKTPKLYFYDTGLASALLGIQQADHLSIHPSRPALFENLVIAEELKRRFNLGLPSNLFFWRDNMGVEIDLVIDCGRTLQPVEIKSGSTVTADFFSGLKRWVSYAGKLAGQPTLVYGGEQSFTREEVAVVGWRKGLPLSD